MELNKAKFAAGDPGEVLKLARSIKASTPLSKTANPIASQFFDDEPSGVRHLTTDTLLQELAGANFTQHVEWIDAVAAAGYAGIKLNRPSAVADVTRIGCGSGWTPPARAVVTTKAGTFEAPVQFKKAAKTESPTHTGLLASTLKSILFELLGAGVENFDPATLKTRITAALKTARPDVKKRLAKALAA